MKKAISLLLALLLVLLCFTACSGKEKKEEKNSVLQITYDSHYENLSESSVRAYNALCNAVINGDEDVVFNGSMNDDVSQLYYTSFPLNFLVESLTQHEDGNGVSIKYKYDTETHLKLVSDFTDKVEEIKNTCSSGSASKDRYIFNLYKYVCENITVDESVLSPYETIMNSAGSTQSISQMFEYLILQNGGKASHIINFDNGVNVASAVYFHNDWYIFYPELELKNNGGKGLTCFAMSFDRATKNAGVDSFEYTDYVKVDSDFFTDTTFDVLQTAESYTEENGKIIANCAGEMFELPL